MHRFFLWLLVGCLATAAEIPHRAYWPTAAWRPLSRATIDPVRLAEMERLVFPPKNEDHRRGIHTDGIVIIKNGFLAYERYARGYGPEMPHVGWSVSKSIASTLMGMAIREGYLTLESRVTDYVPGYSRAISPAITIRDLIHMSSGIRWFEGYEDYAFGSTAIAMLYGAGRKNMVEYVLGLPQEHPPGTHWRYSSGDTLLMVGALRGALGERAHTSHPQRLFDRLGMPRASFEKDLDGNLGASASAFATPRELAKFGYLYLNDGIWEGERVLPEGWVTLARATAPAYGKSTLGHEERKNVYGGHWWVNTAVPEAGVPRPWPDAPADTYAARGYRGQLVFVIPSRDLVIVRTGEDRDLDLDANEFLKRVLATF